MGAYRDHDCYNISIHALLAESDFQRERRFLCGTSISIHALLAESDFRQSCRTLPTYTFLSTLSLRRATCGQAADHCFRWDFYPRSPCGERPSTTHQSTRRTNFYPRSPCGERRNYIRKQQESTRISIHALLAESDDLRRRFVGTLFYFYPRSPCGERQPTTGRNNKHNVDFYPRSPCGERPGKVRVVEPGLLFLSTLSLRRATCILPVESTADHNFYPRSPCGERLLWVLRKVPILGIFLSTLSLRRATIFGLCEGVFLLRISIHALLAESDLGRGEVV